MSLSKYIVVQALLHNGKHVPTSEIVELTAEQAKSLGARVKAITETPLKQSPATPGTSPGTTPSSASTPSTPEPNAGDTSNANPKSDKP